MRYQPILFQHPRRGAMSLRSNRVRITVLITMSVCAISKVRCFSTGVHNRRFGSLRDLTVTPTTVAKNKATMIRRRRSTITTHLSSTAPLEQQSEEIFPPNLEPGINTHSQDLSHDSSIVNGVGSRHHHHHQPTPRMWPCFDELDKRLIGISLPIIANFAINPLIGAVDLFWVNRMGNALAVAGQAAANQVFNSAFWFVSFLPSVTATLVSKENAAGNQEGVEDAVCQALFVGILIATLGTLLLFLNPDSVLKSVLKEGAPALHYAKPYLVIRSFAFLPSLVSLVGFSAFRGILETDTPVKISSFANAFNALLDPILIFTLAMGVPGAALATLAAEVISAVTYLVLLRRRNLIRWSKIFRLPRWQRLKPLLSGGLALQLRNVALNITFLAVARVTQSIDQSGVAAAAHAMAIQVFQVGGIVLLGISSVAQTVVPNDLIERYDPAQGQVVGGIQSAKATVNRLMSWGFILGGMLGALQIAMLPLIRQSTPILEVREAARMPSYLASIYQVMNGLVFIGEGVMIGCGNFLQLSLTTVIATAGCLWALRTFPPTFGLTGVWIGFGVWNSLRLAGVLIHQLWYGPLAPRKMRKATAKVS